MPTLSKKQVGRAGERRAAAFLIAHEHSIMATNMRIDRIGEIDILTCDRDGTIVVVEVKTRSNATFARPEVNITPNKLSTLRRLAQVICSRYPAQNVRVDVVTVGEKIEHFIDVLS